VTFAILNGPKTGSWTMPNVLAPLAPGDYVVELVMDGSAGQTRTLVPFRIVP